MPPDAYSSKKPPRGGMLFAFIFCLFPSNRSQFVFVHFHWSTFFLSGVYHFGLLLSARLQMGRAKPEDAAINRPLCEKYAELARMSVMKAEAIAKYLSELATADMNAEAIKMVIHGGAIKILADEFKGLGDAVTRCVK